MSKFKRVSEEDFEAHRAELEKHFTSNTISLAKLVLVEGKSNTAAAEATGTSRQNVSKAVERVCARMDGHPSNWVRIDNLWAPPDLAAEFRERIQAAKEKTPR
ncbi:TPA: TrfB-related DNA-binding protein [Pseudomonas putida]